MDAAEDVVVVQPPPIKTDTPDDVSPLAHAVSVVVVVTVLVDDVVDMEYDMTVPPLITLTLDELPTQSDCINWLVPIRAVVPVVVVVVHPTAHTVLVHVLSDGRNR